jgi:hypothetical protein
LRLNINLASTPYENARRFYVQWGLALALMIALTVVLAVGAVRTWRANHALSRSIAEERARIEKLNEQEKADLAILAESKNSDVRDRSQALNALIVRKSFSWTRIFNDLEKMMPTQLHVVSIAPQLSTSNQLQIRMMVAGASRDKAIELVQNMEKAPDFQNAQIVSETTLADRKQASDAVTFNIVAEYNPSNSTDKRASATATAEEGGAPAAKNPDEKVGKQRPAARAPKSATGKGGSR